MARPTYTIDGGLSRVYDKTHAQCANPFQVVPGGPVYWTQIECIEDGLTLFECMESMQTNT